MGYNNLFTAKCPYACGANQLEETLRVETNFSNCPLPAGAATRSRICGGGEVIGIPANGLLGSHLLTLSSSCKQSNRPSGEIFINCTSPLISTGCHHTGRPSS